MGEPWELLCLRQCTMGFMAALEECDSRGVEFKREVHEDFSDTQLMLLFLLEELCLVALKDRKEYCEHMVKRKPQQVWTYDNIRSDPPSAVDWFHTLMNTQKWEKAETLAVEVFWGRLCVTTLPLNMTGRLIIGSVFIRMCEEGEGVVQSYVPLRIFPSIYSIAWDHGLLCKGPVIPAEEPLCPRDIPPHLRSFGCNDRERWEDWHLEQSWDECHGQPHVARGEQRRWWEPDRWKAEAQRWPCIRWHRAPPSHQNHTNIKGSIPDLQRGSLLRMTPSLWTRKSLS